MIRGLPSRQVRQGVTVEQLSRHFLRRWIQRLGRVPSLESVNLILRKGQIVKKGQTLFKLVRGRLYPYHTLTQIWNHPEGVLIWIDERRATAVTVVVPKSVKLEARNLELDALLGPGLTRAAGGHGRKRRG